MASSFRIVADAGGQKADGVRRFVPPRVGASIASAKRLRARAGGQMPGGSADDRPVAARVVGPPPRQLDITYVIRDVGIYLLNHLEMDPRGWSRFETSVDLLSVERPAFPSEEGVYVVMSEGTLFTYPAGASSVFYIGQASNLRTRLADHRKYSQQVRDGQALSRYYPRYEWAANHGARVTCAVRPQVDTALTPKAMETHLLRTFGLAFRAPPMANSQSAW